MNRPASTAPSSNPEGHQQQASNRPAIALIGFGEAAQAFVAGWGRDVPVELSAYDSKTDTAGPHRTAKLADYEQAGVTGTATLATALSGAEAIFCLVTADQAHAAARAAAAAGLQPGSLFLDCNSCAPQTKQASAQLIEAAGGRYVDVAVMAPVYPLRHRAPMLVSGPHVEPALALLNHLGMDARDAEGPVGRASAIKLVRSIMMKGLEALAVECLLAGRQLGVDDVVLASLEQTYPGFGWDDRTGQMLERVMVHGVRRAAEMDEAALMVRNLGLPARMAEATAEWQRSVGTLKLADPSGDDATDRRRRRADAIGEKVR